MVASGGIFVASEELGANIAGTEPFWRTTWGSFVTNASACPVTATPEAVCVHA